MSQTVNFYTDGACSGNQNDTNIGGWGAILEYGTHRKELHGGESNTTNNRMELTAVIEAFRQLKRTGLSVCVFSDSSYVVNCFQNRWYESWERKGWVNAKKEPVLNPELWKELLSLVRTQNASFYLVKGHVDLKKSKPLEALYQKFLRKNGSGFSFDDFVYITEQNNRADELANLGIDEIRAEAQK